MNTITKTIGTTERCLLSLLERQIAPYELTFPEWATLVMLSQTDGEALERISAKLADGEITRDMTASALVERLSRRQLVIRVEINGNLRVSLTDAGRDVFARIKGEVDAIVEEICSDIRPEDLALTERTLSTIAQRARQIEAAGEAAVS